MLGYLRFFLAYLVLLSHLDIRFFNLNPGVFAVVFFYILAGSVVSNLWLNVFKQNLSKFYKDRMLRIFPLYFYVLILSFIFIYFTNFGNPSLNLKSTLANIFIIPLNFFMYFDFSIISVDNIKWWLIPPAWSLGTELQAYIFLPFMIMLKRGFILAILSFLVYVAANLGFLHPDFFGYRLIVGVLFMFYLGTLVNEKKWNIIFIFWLVVVFLYMYFWFTNSFSPTYTKETLLGLIVAILTLFINTKIKIKLPLNSLFASLSYGIFLSHFLAIWILEYLEIYNYRVFFVSIISVLIALFGVVFIEKPITKKRIKTKA